MTHSNAVTQPHSIYLFRNFIQTVNREILAMFEHSQFQTTQGRVRAWLLPRYRTIHGIGYWLELTAPYLG